MKLKRSIIALIISFKSMLYMRELSRTLYNETSKSLARHGFEFEQLVYHFLNFVDGLVFKPLTAHLPNSNALNSADLVYNGQQHQLKSYSRYSESVIEKWDARYNDKLVISDGSEQVIGDNIYKSPTTNEIKQDDLLKIYGDTIMSTFYLVVSISVGTELGDIAYGVYIEKKKLSDLINLRNGLLFLVRTAFLFIAMLAWPITLIVFGWTKIMELIDSNNPLRDILVDVFFISLYSLSLMVVGYIVNSLLSFIVPSWLCAILIFGVVQFIYRNIQASFKSVYRFVKKSIKYMLVSSKPIQI